MTCPNNRTVLVGVTGCIGAYKACELVRALQKRGYRVKVVMTKNATEFVGPTTFRALTQEPVAVDMFVGAADPIYHISLAAEADCFVIAPATANILAKMAHGIADDLLSTTALACTKPLIVAPAMNVHMYDAPATQDNMATLRARGVEFVDAEEGYLACGEEGKGRLADVTTIADAVDRVLGRVTDLAGKTVMITAGPTREPLDPVRYLSNNSSGKMGYALARAAAERGAQVVLVSGPVSLPAPAGVHVVPVTTACEMLAAAQEAFASADIAIFTAAVCDMRPAAMADQKLKKGLNDAELKNVALVENPDILRTCAAHKRSAQVVVGFAAETSNVVEYAQRKLEEKGADMIVANDVSHGQVFGADTNKATLVQPSGNTPLELMTKDALAHVILDYARDKSC